MYVITILDNKLVLLDFSLPWPKEEFSFTDTQAVKFGDECRQKMLDHLKELHLQFIVLPWIGDAGMMEPVKIRMDDWVKQMGREW